MEKKTSVLVVDDDLRLCETLKDILIEKGYEADFAENGMEALKTLAIKSYEVVLLDQKMPVMNGLETFRRIKEISPKTVVIAMTAFSLDNMIKSCLLEGVFGILYKPFDIDKLVAHIMAATNGTLVMIIDDNPKICQTLADILREENYLVTIAKDSGEAIEIATRMPHHIIIVDMKLPVLNGLETYLAIKEINPKIKAILMTGYREETINLVKQALEKNAYLCLYKPFEPSRLLAIIKEIV